MSDKHYPKPIDRGTMRRQDRSVDDEAWIVQFLHESPYGVVATQHDGQPFVHINTFVYDKSSHAIYMHTASRGRMRFNVEAENRVAFCVGKMGRLLPAEVAREFSVEFDSVIVFGRMSVVEDDRAARDYMQLLLDKYFPHLKPDKDYRGITPAEVREIAVYRLDIEEWTAKRKEVSDDFPGAFRFGEK